MLFNSKWAPEEVCLSLLKMVKSIKNIVEAIDKKVGKNSQSNDKSWGLKDNQQRLLADEAIKFELIKKVMPMISKGIP